MDRHDSVILGAGVVAISGAVLVVGGVWRGDSTNVVLGASVLTMAGGSLAALGGLPGSDAPPTT